MANGGVAFIAKKARANLGSLLGSQFEARLGNIRFKMGFKNVLELGITASPGSIATWFGIAQRRDVQVFDALFLQGCAQDIFRESSFARHRNRPDIDHALDLGVEQCSDEIFVGGELVTHRLKRVHHNSSPVGVAEENRVMDRCQEKVTGNKFPGGLCFCPARLGIVVRR